jgi:hypothetical protein
METPDTAPSRIEALRSEWTDQYVRVRPERPELRRFGETVGRVVTVNFNGKAVIDFQDGGWYDITAAPQYLVKLDPAEGKAKYDPKTNSAQPFPEKQS